MASTTKTSRMTREHAKLLGSNKKKKLKNDADAVTINKENQKLNESVNYTKDDPVNLEENNMSQDFDDFDFVSHFDENAEVRSDELLPDNTAESALNCAFIGLGGGGGKLAKAFLDLGFNKTILVNTTEKDQPDDVEEDHFFLFLALMVLGKMLSWVPQS